MAHGTLGTLGNVTRPSEVGISEADAFDRALSSPDGVSGPLRGGFNHGSTRMDTDGTGTDPLHLSERGGRRRGRSRVASGGTSIVWTGGSVAEDEALDRFECSFAKSITDHRGPLTADAADFADNDGRATERGRVEATLSSRWVLLNRRASRWVSRESSAGAPAATAHDLLNVPGAGTTTHPRTSHPTLLPDLFPLVPRVPWAPADSRQSPS